MAACTYLLYPISLVTWYPPHSMLTDLAWWLQKLEDGSVMHTLHPCGPLQDLHLYIDASTSWGIGIIIGDHWASFKLSPTWKIMGRDICWLETIAIELLTYFLEEMGLHDCHLLIHSDNQGTIGALDKGHSPNAHINLSVCCMYLLLSHLSISPEIIYVDSLANPADPISCREQGEAGQHLSHNFKPPDKLINSFLHV